MGEAGYQTVPMLYSWTGLSTSEAMIETNPDLIWPRSIEIFDRMRREDAQVGSVLRAVTFPLRKAKWEIDPNGARDEVVKFISRDIGVPIKGQQPQPVIRTKGRFSWQEHLRHALLELPFGHSFFEQVYRIDTEPDGAPFAGDLLAHLDKLAWRPPRTIARLDVSKDGGLQALWQKAPGGGAQDIKIKVGALVAYVNEREGGGWLGQSLLRTAYKNWLLKDRMLRAQALTIERNGLGVPVYTAAPVPEGASREERNDWQESEKSAGLALAKGFRAGEAAGAAIPHGSELHLKGVEGTLPQTDPAIRYHDEQIARAVLAHFLNLGTETGSWALGSTFANFFTDSLNAVATHVADVTNQHVIEDLVDLNWGTQEPAPRIVCEPIGAQAPITAKAIMELVACGALTLDDPLETHLRATYGLPVHDPATARVAPQISVSPSAGGGSQ